MRLDYFRFVMKRERAFWDITAKYTLFTDGWELYNNDTKEGKEYKKLENLLDVIVEGKTIKERIEELDQFPDLEYRGGRGAGSGAQKTFKFGHADLRGQGENGASLPPAMANTKIKSKTFEGALNEFKKNHLLANREFAYEVDDNGYVYQYVKGAQHSVAINSSSRRVLPKGAKTMIIHNHPSASNFSDGDMLSTAADTRSKGIIASGKNYDYKFTKTGHFKAKPFSKAIKNATLKGDSYDDAVDKWLAKNQKKYGYIYSKKKN